MKLLAKLLDSLTPEETQRLLVLPVRGKQRAVLLMAIHHRDSPERVAEELAVLGISKGHFYEISSHLLRMAYQTLAEDDTLTLLEMLAHRNLTLHFERELKRIEPSYQGKRSEEAADFYFTVFELFHAFAYNLVNWKAIEEYGQKYLEALPVRTADDDTSVVVRHLMNAMIRLQTDQLPPPEQFRHIFDELTSIELRSRTSSHALLRYNIYTTLSLYWQIVGDDQHKMLECLLKSEEFVGLLPVRKREEKVMLVQLRIADLYNTFGEIQEAIRRFASIFTEDTITSSNLRKQSYFLLRYCECLIYADHFHRAESLLVEYFEPLFGTLPTTTIGTAAGSFVFLYLFTGDYERAKKYLDRTIELNTKNNFTFLTEVRNRFLEAAYYYLVGDWEYAYAVCDRALHYLRTNGLRFSDSNIGYKFKIIQASTNYYQSGAPFSKELDEEFAKLHFPVEGLFGKLTILIRQTNAIKRSKH